MYDSLEKHRFQINFSTFDWKTIIKTTTLGKLILKIVLQKKKVSPDFEKVNFVLRQKGEKLRDIEQNI